MLARREVREGTCFVNTEQQAAREILGVDHEIVTYNVYDLKTGKLCGAPHQQSPRGEVIHWADREATEDETRLLQRAEVAAVFEVEESVPIEIPRVEAVREEARRNTFTS